MLGVLQAVEAGELKSQRHIAAEVGIALGLANFYVKRCVRKGLMKVAEAPARRYAYYLTPEGFAEKSRLTAEYLSYSFTFFRQARTDCAAVFDAARSRKWTRVALLGISELAEIAALCALDAEITVVAVVDASQSRPRFVGIPVVTSLEGLADRADGLVLCAIREKDARMAEAYEAFGASRVLAPKLLAGPAGRAWNV